MTALRRIYNMTLAECSVLRKVANDNYCKWTMYEWVFAERCYNGFKKFYSSVKFPTYSQSNFTEHMVNEGVIFIEQKWNDGRKADQCCMREPLSLASTHSGVQRLEGERECLESSGYKDKLLWKASIFIVVCNRLVKGILLMIVVRNETLRDKYVREMKKVKKWKTGSEGQYMCPVGCCSVQCLLLRTHTSIGHK